MTSILPPARLVSAPLLMVSPPLRSSVPELPMAPWAVVWVIVVVVSASTPGLAPASTVMVPVLLT